MGVGCETAGELVVSELAGKGGLGDLEVADDAEHLRAGDEARLRRRLLEPGVEHEQITRSELQQAPLVGAGIAVGEALELGIEVDSVSGALER